MYVLIDAHMKNRPSTQSASLSLPTHKSQENYDLRLMSLRENRPFFKNCNVTPRTLYAFMCGSARALVCRPRGVALSAAPCTVM